MKITVIEGHTMNPGDLSWDCLREFGELSVFEHYTDDENEVIRRIGDAEIVVANKSGVSRRVIDACPNIKYITIMATGYDPVDYIYAKEKGIPVSNVPAYGTASVAQFAISLLLEICGRAAIILRPCIRAAGLPAGNGASGTIPLLSLRERPWESSVLGVSVRLWGP